MIQERMGSLFDHAVDNVYVSMISAVKRNRLLGNPYQYLASCERCFRGMWKQLDSEPKQAFSHLEWCFNCERFYTSYVAYKMTAHTSWRMNRRK